MADSITQIKCLPPWFKRQSLASWTKMFHFTKVSISAGNMSVCVARDLGFTLKRGLGQFYFFISFFFFFFHIVSVHSAPICFIYMSVCCTLIDFDMYVCLFLIVYWTNTVTEMHSPSMKALSLCQRTQQHLQHAQQQMKNNNGKKQTKHKTILNKKNQLDCHTRRVAWKGCCGAGLVTNCTIF